MVSAIPMSNRGGLISIKSNADLDEEAENAARQAADEKNNSTLLRGLAGHVMGCWEAARSAKTPITERLLRAQRARAGKYDPEKLASIKEFGGSEEYARITDNKCRTAEAWLNNVYLGQTDKPWQLTPGKVPDLPPDVVLRVKQTVGQQLAQMFVSTGGMPNPQDVSDMANTILDAEKQRLDDEAREIVDRMGDKIEDQLEEGGWHGEWAAFISDVTTYPSAHFKGPILRKNQSLDWANVNGQWVPQVDDSVKMEFQRVDPFHIYPAPGITDPQQGYMCEYIPMSRDDLYSLIGVPGYDEAAIRAVLEEYGKGGLTDWMGLTAEYQKQLINDVPIYGKATHNVLIDCLEYHGPVRGEDLLDWGLDPSQVPDDDKDYECVVWLVGRWVIKAQINPDPLKRRPYYKTSYKSIPGAYWGNGLVDLLDDVQGVVNATIRSLVNNMSMASGPMVGVNVDRLPAGVDLTQIHPWMLVQFVDSQYGNSTDKPIDFFQPQSNVQDLLMVLDKFYSLADDFSMIPRMMAGQSPTGGVGRSATGMSMLLNTANVGLKGVVSDIDTYVMAPLINAIYNYNMLFDTDTTIKGDAKVVASGATSLMQLESLQLRRNEFLNATNNPTDTQIVGIEGRAEILREVAKGLNMDVNRVIPPRPVLKQKQAAIDMSMGAGAPPEAPGGGDVLPNGAPTVDNFSHSADRNPGK